MLQILMLSCLVFLPVRGVALPILMGVGRPRVPTIAFLVRRRAEPGNEHRPGRPFGLAGVALGTAMPNVLVRDLRARRYLPRSFAYLSVRISATSFRGRRSARLPMLALLLWFKFGLASTRCPG